MTDTTTIFVTNEDQIVSFRPPEQSLADNFARFNAENPHVYETLVMLAQDWRLRHPGAKCGIGMLFEVARWQLGVRGDGEPVALNNNYRAFYARLMMDNEPGLDGMFEIRRQRNDDVLDEAPVSPAALEASVGDSAAGASSSAPPNPAPSLVPPPGDVSTPGPTPRTRDGGVLQLFACEIDESAGLRGAYFDDAA